MSKNIPYLLLRQNFYNQQRLQNHLQKLVKIKNNNDLEFNLNLVLQWKTLDFSLSTPSSIVKNLQVMTLVDVLDELIFRDSFNTIYEFCKSDVNLKTKLCQQDWFHISKFLRDILTHGKVSPKYFKSLEWQKSYKKHGFTLTWENIQNSTIPQIPKRRRPYLKFFKDMKKFVKELETEFA